MPALCFVLRVVGNDRLKYGIIFRNPYLGELQNTVQFLFIQVSMSHACLIYCVNNTVWFLGVLNTLPSILMLITCRCMDEVWCFIV